MKHLKTFQKIKKLEKRLSKLNSYDCDDCLYIGQINYQINLLTKKLKKQIRRDGIFKLNYLNLDYLMQKTIKSLFDLDFSKCIFLDSYDYPFNPFYFDGNNKIFFNSKNLSI
jgi:hypothetical protein